MQSLRDFRRSAAGALATLVVMAVAAVALSACNTAAGFGQDMTVLGHAITGSADNAKSN